MIEPYVIQHPLAQHHLSVLRDKHTDGWAFRHSLAQLTRLVAIEATRDLQISEYKLTTPLRETAGFRLSERHGLVPILRAGAGMVDPVLELLPEAEVWHLGLYRDEQTATPVHYYSKLAPGHSVDRAWILDPMLATGGSACLACQTLAQWGVRQIKMLSIIAAPEGIARLSSEHPQTEVFTCAVDECLNDDHFIVPGLGDAGDRIFNTVT